MTAPENPERMWVSFWRSAEGAHYRHIAIFPAGKPATDGCDIPQEYVRQDIAARETALAVYVARIDTQRELSPCRQVEIGEHILYRSLSTGTFVIRRKGDGSWLVDEPTCEACVLRGIAMGLLPGPGHEHGATSAEGA